MTQTLHSKLFEANGIRVDVLRLDLIHPEVSGNKWFKLKYSLGDALAKGMKGMVSFGGAYSNHLVAMAYVCHRNGLRSTGIIRGEELSILNSSLQQMQEYGMEFIFVKRDAYKQKDLLIDTYLSEHTGYYYVPEGGQSEEGIRGASEILRLAEENYTHVLCAVGTGTTLSGIINGSSDYQEILGICSLKIPVSMENELLAFIEQHTTRKNYKVLFNYHFGGYARKTQELIDFMNELYTEEKIPTDFVYTGKLFYATRDLLQKKYFSRGARVLIIHSGGLQGNRSLPKGTLVY